MATQKSQLLHFNTNTMLQNPNQQQHHQMQQMMHHHYATLHHHHQQQQATPINNHQQLINHHHQSSHGSSSNGSSSNGSQTMPFLNHHHHHHQQQQQQQLYNQQQHQQQNSSDYSSSTYHVYDQILGCDQIIDDLIVIKQERMKKKLEQEHKRKVILFSCALILLVGLLLFLLVQLFKSSTSLSAATTTTMRADEQQTRHFAAIRPGWPAPSFGAQPQQPRRDTFDASKQFSQQMLPHQHCSGHGQLQVLSLDQPLATCRCDAGYAGEQCQEALVKCHQMGANFCNNNGLCDRRSGLCNCLPPFYGLRCEHQHQQQQKKQHFRPNSEPIPMSKQFETSAICQAATKNCHGNGRCSTLSGRCECFQGFAGESCELRIAPEVIDLCRGTNCGLGQCDSTSGLCRCPAGFAGLNCELLLMNEASVSNCSRHGQLDATSGRCVCDLGFSGPDCSLVNTSEIVLSSAPEVGRKEATITTATATTTTTLDCDNNNNNNNNTISSTLDCGPFGAYSCSERRCICQDGYTGELCRLARCSARCLRNGGLCAPDGQCSCPPGRFGRQCSFDGCPNGCSSRGECQQVGDEWRCQCQTGATGDDCSLASERQCDDNLDNDGDGLVDCADSECCGDRACQNSTLCMKSHDPLAILMRKQPLPATSSFFQRMQFLIEKFSSQTYSNPKDFNDSRASVIRGRVTYMKQGVTGVRVSVAGQISLGITLTRDDGHFDLLVNGGGAVLLEFRREPFAILQTTVRVPWNEIVLLDSVEMKLEHQANEQQQDNKQQQATSGAQEQANLCSAHNYRLMRPQIIATGSRRKPPPQASKQVGSNKLNHAHLLRDSALVQQTIVLLPQNNNNANHSTPSSQMSEQQVSLVYSSSKANEFMSTVQIQLTPQSKLSPAQAEELKLVHLRIIIEGNLFEQRFEAQTNLSFTWAWNRRNVYKQKSFGQSTALISVGYEYFDCVQVIWHTRSLQLAGHDLSISDIGNGQWNFNIHHRYNQRDAILQRGDGENLDLRKERPLVVVAQMGDGYQRAPMCPYCDGQSAPPSEHRLLRPQSLLVGPDNALYVGDHNLVRRMEAHNSGRTSERTVRTVLELPGSKQQLRYSLAFSSQPEPRLFLADQERAQVFYVRQFDASSNSMSMNETSSQQQDGDLLVPVVGSGLKCELETSRDNCADSGPARLARLIEPRSLVFDLTNRMYLADGPTIRVVEPPVAGSEERIIYTLLGHYSRQSSFDKQQQLPCLPGETIPMHKFSPRAPLSLALSPIDDALHFLDDNVIYKVTQDKRIQLVLGRPGHCSPATMQKSSATSWKASEFAFQAAQSITFKPNGHLLVAEDEPRLSLARVLLLEPDEDSIKLYAGQQQQASSSSEEQEVKLRSSNSLAIGTNHSPAPRASEHRFASIGAIAVDQRGQLLVAERQQPRVVSVEPELPQMTLSGEYEIQTPDAPDELLVFNRFGHHVATRDLTRSSSPSSSSSSSSSSAPRNKYTFNYNINTAFGQLVSINYGGGSSNKLSIHRDGPQHSVKLIETTLGSGGQCKLEISRQGQVQMVELLNGSTTSSSNKIQMSYQPESGLLKSSKDLSSSEEYEFDYDEFGRAKSIGFSSPRLAAPVECRLQARYNSGKLANSLIGRECSALILGD